MARHFVIQWELKPKPIAPRSHRFSRTFVSATCMWKEFDWFTESSFYFVIGLSDYFGFQCFRHSSIEKRNIQTMVSSVERKQARMFVCGHRLFREENSYLRAYLDEDCKLLGTDNVREQICEHISPQMATTVCVRYPSNIFAIRAVFNSPKF